MVVYYLETENVPNFIKSRESTTDETKKHEEIYACSGVVEIKWIGTVVYWHLIFCKQLKMDPNTLPFSKYFKKIFRFTSTYLIKIVGVCDGDVLLKQQIHYQDFFILCAKLVFLSDLYTELKCQLITNKDLPCLEYLSGLQKTTPSVFWCRSFTTPYCNISD